MPQSGELEPAAAAPMNWLPIILAMAGGRQWPPMHGGKGRRATAARAGGSRLCGRSGSLEIGEFLRGEREERGGWLLFVTKGNTVQYA
jgi:hypothetical protein